MVKLLLFVRTDLQTDRRTADIQIDKHTDVQTEIWANIQMDSSTDIQTDGADKEIKINIKKIPLMFSHLCNLLKRFSVQDETSLDLGRR
jgi:hypothetical protein